jgi:hypothetical protein
MTACHSGGSGQRRSGIRNVMIGHEARQSSDLKALHWQTRPRGGIGRQGLFRPVANPRRTISSRSRDTSVRAELLDVAPAWVTSGRHRRGSEIPPRSGRGGRRFKSCHSDQHLAKIESVSATGSGDEGRTCEVDWEFGHRRREPYRSDNHRRQRCTAVSRSCGRLLGMCA